MQRSVSELEAATGEKKGGGDVSGVRYSSHCMYSSFIPIFLGGWGERGL